jgi:alpha-beta hydrolase superfamily lysophospholipase
MQLEVLHQAPDTDTNTVPVLFIHGAWHGAWCWENFMPFLAERGYESYALSLRGHGNSPGDHQWASIDDYVSDIRKIAETIYPHPVLVGHSMGGFLAQKYLERYHRDVPGAVLVASMPINGQLALNLRLLRDVPGTVGKMFLRQDSYALIEKPEIARNLFFSEGLPAEDLERHHARMVKESLRIPFEAAFNLPQARRYHPMPMLVMGAIHDTIFTRNEVRQTARVYGTEAEFFNIAHNMMLDVGWEAVAERLAGWMDTHVRA